ncbi:exosortase F system-associated membrane protein [Flavobacterium indicum]|uniref:exosortase F system-associated membrane protein n=1 Tax=Flavobacterium indicum TaxID=312277 RepID=UPI0002E5BE7F
MWQKLLQNKKQLVFVLLFVLGLVLIRAFENELFYDPFLEFFKDDFQNHKLPKFNSIQLFFGLLFRYTLNSIFTVLIIKTLFQQKSIVNLTLFLLLLFFCVLVIAMFFILHFSKQPDYLTLFYIRRFLIQPLFLILFIPAFFYQKTVQ